MKLADPFALQRYTSALLLRPYGMGLASPAKDVSTCGDHVAVEGVSHWVEEVSGGVSGHPQGQKVKVISSETKFVRATRGQ